MARNKKIPPENTSIT